MIDVHDMTNRIIDANRSPVPGGQALTLAIREATKHLAECWDDCVATLPPKLRDADAPNPYRLALEMTPDGPHAPRVEFVDEPDAKSDTESDDRQRHLFVTTTDDAELIAMQIVVQALDGLEPRTQQRIIRYVSERIA